MLVVGYSKLNGAQFISHLDTLRHLQKTVIRSKVAVGYSKGFNPHMLIFLSAPIGVGLKSEAEYFFLETDEKADGFKEKFNAFCPGGFKANFAVEVTKNPNLQHIIDCAEYRIVGDASNVPVEEMLSSNEFFVTDKKGEQKEVRDRILSLKKCDNGLIARLSFGNATLRADVFANKLSELYGFICDDIIKTACFVGDVPAEKYITENFGIKEK